jgi:hypothetical protein
MSHWGQIYLSFQILIDPLSDRTFARKIGLMYDTQVAGLTAISTQV